MPTSRSTPTAAPRWRRCVPSLHPIPASRLTRSLFQYIIRKAFDCAPGGKPYLPKEILWRQKEQFSDGVGYSWIDGMKDHAEATVSDETFAKAAERWPVDTPLTKEAYWIREVFESESILLLP